MHAKKSFVLSYLIVVLFSMGIKAEQRKQMPFGIQQGVQHYQKALGDVAIFTDALKLNQREKIEALLYLDTLVRCKSSELYQQKTAKANKLLTFVAHHANELQKLTSPGQGIVPSYKVSLPQQFILEAIDIIQHTKNGSSQQSASLATSTTLKSAYNSALDRLHTIILFQTQQLNDEEFNDLLAQVDYLGNNYLSTVVQKSIPPKAVQLFSQLETLYKDIVNKKTPEPLQKTAQELADTFKEYAKQALTTYRQAHLPY